MGRHQHTLRTVSRMSEPQRTCLHPRRSNFKRQEEGPGVRVKARAHRRPVWKALQFERGQIWRSQRTAFTSTAGMHLAEADCLPESQAERVQRGKGARREMPPSEKRRDDL